jgi:hypothetical protein
MAKSKNILVCDVHRDKQLVYSWDAHDWVCPVCGGRNCVSVPAAEQPTSPADSASSPDREAPPAQSPK